MRTFDTTVTLRASSAQLPRIREQFESGQRTKWNVAYGPDSVEGCTLVAIADCSKLDTREPCVTLGHEEAG